MTQTPHLTPNAEFVPINDIIIPPDRQRHDFDPAALLELKAGILEVGLLHAIAVRSDGRTLVAGERRLRTIREHIYALGGRIRYAGQDVPEGMVPVVKVSSDDPVLIEAAELYENIHRRDLTWQERLDAETRLHALRAKQNPEQTPVMTAKEIAGVPLDTPRASPEYPVIETDRVRKSIVVAKYLNDPAIAKAKSLDDAFKLVKKKEEGERVAILGKLVGETFHKGLHKVFNAQCLDWMADYIQSGAPKFDVICTDPPYGMGAHEFGDGAGRLGGIEHRYEDSYEHWKELMDGPNGWCNLSYQIVKDQAHAYIFCDIERFYELKLMMEHAGWYVFRTPLINYKVNTGRVPLPDLGPRRQYEVILYAIKGKKPTTGLYSDVIKSEPDEQLTHGAQKPVSLYTDLLKRSVRPGDLVIDTFAGTGPIFPAAHSLQVVATGVEMEPIAYGRCVERLNELE